MDKCDHCGKRIVAGGIRFGEFRYCNGVCYEEGVNHRLREELPPEEVIGLALRMRGSPCISCKKYRPVDFYKSYRIYSAYIAAEWEDYTHLTCRWCARKKQIGHGLVSLLFGWWSLEGLFLTPVYLFKNMRELLRGEYKAPSEQLMKRARFQMAGVRLEQLEPTPPMRSFRPASRIGIGGWILILLLVGFLIFVIYLQNTDG